MLYVLERLAGPAAGVPPPPARDALRAAVRRQIERVVSSHLWPGAPGLELMGMNLPPLAGFGYAAAPDIERFRAGLQALLLQQEPRLQDPQVALAPTGQALMPYELVVRGWLAEAPDAPESFRFPLRRQA